MQRVHFIHIGKTGGSAIKHALRTYRGRRPGIVLHDHPTTLAEVPVGEKAIFVLRDPLDRFVSGFNSRRRQGRPRYEGRWSAAEEAAFASFPSPGDLAEALSSSDGQHRAKAAAAMRAIQHVNSFYADWLVSLEYLRTRRADILWVGRTETLTEDFADLIAILGLPRDCRLPHDPIAAHRRLSSDPVGLAPPMIANIKRWYAADYAFLEHFFGSAAAPGAAAATGS